jgi:predicted porin
MPATRSCKKTDREDFLVAYDETETQMDTYKLGVNGRLGPVRARIRYTHQDIDDPFANATASGQGGACEAYGEQPPTGGNWRTGLQYFQFWDTRTEDMSNMPEDRDEIVANVTYPIKHNLSLTGNYRWVDEDTTSGEGEVNMPSVSLWYAPNPKLSFTLTYLYDDEERQSRICVPVFNG